MAGLLRQIKNAVEQLNPAEVRELAERPLRVRLVASHSSVYAAMEDYLVPPYVTDVRRTEAMTALFRAGDPGSSHSADVEIVEEGLGGPKGVFYFHPAKPHRTVEAIVDRRPDLRIALSRVFPPFRKAVTDRVIAEVSKENAMFSIVTALPDIAPGWALPWAIPEAASDTAVLTMNQVRMAFLLAGASDRDIGYSQQRAEIGGIVAGAFGFRAIARQLISKIPLGGGVIPKAAIAYAGTWVEGRSLEKLYRVGYAYSRDERKAAYEDAFDRGREVAGRIVDSLKKKPA